MKTTLTTGERSYIRSQFNEMIAEIFQDFITELPDLIKEGLKLDLDIDFGRRLVGSDTMEPNDNKIIFNATFEVPDAVWQMMLPQIREEMNAEQKASGS